MTSEHLPPSLIRKFQVDQQERFARRARSYLRRQTLKDAPKLNDDWKGLGSFGAGSLDEQFDATLIEFAQRSQDCCAGGAGFDPKWRRALRCFRRVAMEWGAFLGPFGLRRPVF
jgi:hypothetical protein